jgi:hypothetical protein
MLHPSILPFDAVAHQPTRFRRVGVFSNAAGERIKSFQKALVAAGVALSQVWDLLGHGSIITTERYDNQTFAALQSAAGKLDRGLQDANVGDT